MKPSLYEQIGGEQLTLIITAFYERAFIDPIIGHFFHRIDREHLIAQQIVFSSCMLGAKDLTYGGKSLREAHRRLPLTEVHFRRRQKLLQQVLGESPIAPAVAGEWLSLEEKLKGLIINNSTPCV
jgi:truncated hemoglobin YjbI